MRMDELAYEMTVKKQKLIPVVVQDYATSKVLMVAYANAEALKETLRTGFAHYWSRSRQEIWHKGGTSGHTQKVKEIYVDCDDDTILLKVEQKGGAACHTGYESCFHKKVGPKGEITVMGQRVFNPEKVYKK